MPIKTILCKNCNLSIEDNELPPSNTCPKCHTVGSLFEVPEGWYDRCSGNGHKRYTDENGNRRYVDNNLKTSDMPFRPCARCGQYPNENGDDHCIQNLGKVVNACCGHGTHKGYVMFDDGTIIRGFFEIERPNSKEGDNNAE